MRKTLQLNKRRILQFLRLNLSPIIRELRLIVRIPDADEFRDEMMRSSDDRTGYTKLLEALAKSDEAIAQANEMLAKSDEAIAQSKTYIRKRKAPMTDINRNFYDVVN